MKKDSWTFLNNTYLLKHYKFTFIHTFVTFVTSALERTLNSVISWSKLMGVRYEQLPLADN